MERIQVLVGYCRHGGLYGSFVVYDIFSVRAFCNGDNTDLRFRIHCFFDYLDIQNPDNIEPDSCCMGMP